MPVTIIGFPERQETICMQTSRKHCIPNGQNRIVHQQAIDQEERQRALFGNGEFQGNSTCIYNCHGLTFASKRTGVFADEAIRLILDDEYVEINRANVIVGDVVLYYYPDRPGEYAHSAIVVEKSDIIGSGLFGIRVLSKTRFHREIVHYAGQHSYPGTEIKFYRINHEPVTII
jgi:hypothetical protein